MTLSPEQRELQAIRHLLQRLVDLEEERREGERQMEQLTQALLPPPPADATPPEPAAAPDGWWRDAAGILRTKDETGQERPLTTTEVRLLTASPRRMART